MTNNLNYKTNVTPNKKTIWRNTARKNKFGKRLRQIRLEKKISQEQLAFKSGLHRTYICDIERGVRNVSLVNIEKIAKGLNVKINDLISWLNCWQIIQHNI